MKAFRTAVVALVLASLPLASPARAESPDRVLIFTKTAGFRHDSIPATVDALQALGRGTGLEVDATEDPAMFDDATLSPRFVVAYKAGAAERVHAKPGVVGHRGATRRRRGMARLGECVLDEGVVWLGGLGDAQVSLAHQLHAQGGEHGLQLGELAAVVRCQYDFHSQIGLQRLFNKR